MEHRYILITGLMGSGKSTILNEFIYEYDTMSFNPPPVEAKFRGMDFEFIDQIFGLEKRGVKYNFFELDAPTVNKWTQFIETSDAIIIVHNYTKSDYYEDPKEFIDKIDQHTEKTVPIFFVVNNCNSLEKAKSQLIEVYSIGTLENEKVIKTIPSAEIYYTKAHGKRVELDPSKLKELYDEVIQRIEPES